MLTTLYLSAPGEQIFKPSGNLMIDTPLIETRHQIDKQREFREKVVPIALSNHCNVNINCP